MFKFETVVAIMICSLWVSGSGAAGNSNAPDCNLSEQYLHDAEEAGKPAARITELKTRLKECRDSGRPENDDSCNKVTADYKKAKTAFEASCGPLPSGDLSDPPGSISCSFTIARCACIGKKPENQPAYLKCDAGDGEVPSGLDAKNIKASKQFSQCPIIAATDLDKVDTQIDKQKEKVQKLEKEIPELQDKANKVISNTNEKLTNMRTKALEAQTKYAEDIEKLSNSKDEAEKAISDQVVAAQAEILKNQDALAQVGVEKLKGKMELKQTKIKIELNCHASASAQVAKMQGDALVSIQAGTYNRGGFTSLMRNVGVSDRAQWQKVAQKYYNWCLESKPTMDSKDGANDVYSVLVAQSNKSENSIRERITQLQQQQLTLRDNNACGAIAGGPETQLCKNVRKATDAANRLGAALQSKQQAAAQEAAQLQQQGTNEYNALKQQAANKSQEIKDEKTRLKSLEDLYALKNEKGNGASVTQKDYSEARAKYSALAGDADKMVTTCSKAGETCGPDCQRGLQFLNSIQGKTGDPRVDPENIPRDVSQADQTKANAVAPAAIPDGPKDLPADGAATKEED